MHHENKTYICNFIDCGLMLKDPVTLSCGNNLCKKHLDQFCTNFKCNFCHKMHTIPDEGYQVNQLFVDMIENYIRSDPIKNEIKESFDKLNKTIDDYENMNQDEYISDYFFDLKLKVILHREELIKEINDRSTKIIKELNDKEIKCKTNKVRLEYFDLFDLKNDLIPNWNVKLRIPDLRQDQSQQILNEIHKNNQKIQDQLERNKIDCLLGESIEFNKSLQSTIVGKLVVYSNDNSLSINCGQLIKSFDQHSSLVNSIKVDEFSNKLITASFDKSIKIWDLETGECLKTLKDHKHCVTSILIFPNNKFISGSIDKTMKIWDLNSYDCLDTLNIESEVLSLCSLHQDNQIACGCIDGTINIWNLNDLNNVKSVKAHNDWITYLLLVDKTKLISCSGQKDQMIKIWSLCETIECIKVLEGHSDIIYYLELTSDGNLMSCSRDQTVKLWHIESGEMMESIKFDSNVCCVERLNNNLIAIALSNGEILIYNINQMNYVKRICSTNSSCVYRLVFLSNGNLFSAFRDGKIMLLKIFD